VTEQSHQPRQDQAGQHTTIMAYYTSQTGQHPAASGAYPYSTYSYTHPQTPGAYPYTTGAYPGTAITGYGAAWPYSYSYYQHQPTSLSKPAASQSTPTLPANAQRTTFTAYNPTYSRDSAGTGVASGPSARAYKKQSNFKGLFTKERASDPGSLGAAHGSTFLLVRNLMFGFGDDRNPSNDTVNVMEEILVEYIADIVGFPQYFYPLHSNNTIHSVPNSPCAHQKVPSVNRGLPQGTIATS
jgi:transcription initiation factor TFIID subunit 13